MDEVEPDNATRDETSPSADASELPEDPAKVDESDGADPPGKPEEAPAALTPLLLMRAARMDREKAPPVVTDQLNAQIVQAVRLTNREVADQAAAQISIPPDMMIAQASGLMAEAAARYFDNVSAICMTVQAVLLKDMAKQVLNKNMPQAECDAIGALATNQIAAAAAAVASMTGAVEASAINAGIATITAAGGAMDAAFKLAP